MSRKTGQVFIYGKFLLLSLFFVAHGSHSFLPIMLIEAMSSIIWKNYEGLDLCSANFDHFDRGFQSRTIKKLLKVSCKTYGLKNFTRFLTCFNNSENPSLIDPLLNIITIIIVITLFVGCNKDRIKLIRSS